MVYKTLVTGALALSFAAFAETTPDALAKRVSEAPSALPESVSYSIKNSVSILSNISKNHKPSTCVEKTIKKNSYKFATTYNEKGEPCKVYDLSFQTLTTPIRIASLPLQEFDSDDYDAWLDGNKKFVYDRMEAYKNNFGFSAFSNSWVSKLDFKDRSFESRFRTSFTLDELNIDQAFAPNFPEQADLIKALQLAGVEADSPLYDVANNPRSILSKIKINWNDLEKVYDVFIDFDFLPIKGPVHLVDYKRPYDMAVNKIIRSLVFKVVTSLATYIPEPTTQRIVKVVLTDIGEFMDMTYDYRFNALEDTLRMNIEGKIATQVTPAEAKKAMNILFANESSLLTQYLSSLITGQTFDLNKMEEIGNQARYNAEKQRKNTAANINSDLYWGGCDMSQIHGYFGVCKKKGENFGLYSLLSERKVFIWTLGASPIHYYKVPVSVPLMRYTSWLLSMGARIIPLPISSKITGQLVSILKNFAKSGMIDEAFLLNYYTELKYANNSVDANASYLMPYLYAQNIIPWMPKTEKWENAVVNGNNELLQKIIK